MLKLPDELLKVRTVAATLNPRVDERDGLLSLIIASGSISNLYHHSLRIGGQRDQKATVYKNA